MLTAHPACEPSCGHCQIPVPSTHPLGYALQLMAMCVVPIRLLLPCSSCWRWGGPESSAGEDHSPMTGRSRVHNREIQNQIMWKSRI